ncbi:hypothetical protein J2W95_002289 [Flavobacterium granuli]|uniref:Uncharacterized protein n=1 Tax=Flavobacterium granuli TaxID=280093 RepID=A0ABU1S3G1_9FLAO|nr:hypothetical protein [Flavobacterium granuli]
MKPRVVLYLLLIIFNLVSLYFIIVLFSYDEIVGYLIDGGKKIDSTRKLAYLFFMTSLSNLYFLSISLMEYTFKDKI